MKKTLARLGILGILAMAGALACVSASVSEYQAAAQKYESDSVAYSAAGGEIAKARANGAVTDAQWARFVSDQDAVRAADARVFADLATWRTSNTKPMTYDANAAALFAAQMRVVALAAEVKR